MFYCPVCKSQEIYPAAGGYIGQIYLCKDCGYRGSFVLEIDDSGENGDAAGEEPLDDELPDDDCLDDGSPGGDP